MRVSILILALVLVLIYFAYRLYTSIIFMIIVKKLDTPKKIAQYMHFNFDYEYQARGAKSPYELFLKKKGDCNDFSGWVAWIGHYHGYKTYQLRLILEGINHWLGIFDMGGYYLYTDNQFINTTRYHSFEEIAEFYKAFSDKKLIGFEVYDHETVRVK